MDEGGQTVTALGQTGEIAVKGPQVMAGYWQRPDETAKVTTAESARTNATVVASRGAATRRTQVVSQSTPGR